MAGWPPHVVNDRMGTWLVTDDMLDHVLATHESCLIMCWPLMSHD